MIAFIRRKLFADDDVKTLGEWQERSFQVIFSFICLLSIPVVVRSLVQSFHDGLYANLFLFTACYVVALFITFAKFLRFRVRALAGVGILFAAGMIGLFTVGPVGSGRIFLFVSGIFATVMLGVRFGLAVFALQIAVLVSFAHLLRTDFETWARLELYSHSSWVTSSTTLAFLSLIFIVAIGRMIGGMGLTFSRLEQTNRELSKSDTRFETIVEHANDIIFEIDAASQTFSYVSSTCRSLLGYEREDVLWASFRKFLHEDDIDMAQRMLRASLEDGAVHGETEYRVRHRNGTWRWHQTKGGPVRDPDGRIVGFAGISRDVTERKEIEGELLRAKEVADAATKAKSEFLANMSHEIRTPLNGVMGMIQLMQLTGLDEEQAEYAQTAMESCRRLVRLLTDILDISRIEANLLCIQRAPMDLGEVLAQTSGLFSPISRESGVDLRIDFDPAIPARLYGDAARLQQVLTNLVGNALKFTPSGSVSLEVSRLRDIRPGECRVHFCVRDTGIGIPDDKLDSLFKPFSQVTEGFTRSHQGAGLGLSICRRLVGLMGGNMSVISEAGSGTEVHFCLGFAMDGAAEAESGPGRPVPELSLEGVRILLAEDDRFSMVLAERLFTRSGAKVEVAADGYQVIEALSRANFDLVIMDIQMPGMDGVEATRAIRAGQAGSRMKYVPVIAMTAYAMIGDRERFLEAGMDGYVSKPFEIEELLRVIGDVMRRRVA
jgi:PAS domain S-box-containing protein